MEVERRVFPGHVADASQELRRRVKNYLRHQSFFGAAVPSGGTNFITNTVGFSFEPKGPATLCLSGGRLLRNAAIAIPPEPATVFTRSSELVVLYVECASRSVREPS